MICLREAKIDDATQIGRVQVDNWKTGYNSFVPNDLLNNLSYDERISFWQSAFSLNNSYSQIWCAVKDDKIIGFAHFGLAPNKHPKFKGELRDIHVLSEYRGKGIGEKLFYKGIDFLIDKNIKSLIVWVFSGNSYRKFYEKMGGKIAYKDNWPFFGLNLDTVSYGWNNLPLLEINKKL